MTTHDSEQRPQQMAPFQNTETAIRHEVEAVAQRFPDTDIARIDEAVREVFGALKADAEVETHLLALTRHRVYDRLQEQGHVFRPGIVDGTESEAGGDVVADSGSDTRLRANSDPKEQGREEHGTREPTSTPATSERPD
ncbi:hypothetical protein K1W54_14405 [Micromonospora sp. CPCC 205371]|nr:hypothetical protein [Micromonospora sp. CPCC 205371]